MLTQTAAMRENLSGVVTSLIGPATRFWSLKLEGMRQTLERLPQSMWYAVDFELQALIWNYASLADQGVTHLPGHLMLHSNNRMPSVTPAPASLPTGVPLTVVPPMPSTAAFHPLPAVTATTAAPRPATPAIVDTIELILGIVLFCP